MDWSTNRSRSVRGGVRQQFHEIDAHRGRCSDHVQVMKRLAAAAVGAGFGAICLVAAWSAVVSSGQARVASSLQQQGAPIWVRQQEQCVKQICGWRCPVIN